MVGGVSDNILFLDPRSVLPEEDPVVLQALRQAAAGLNTV